MSPAGRAAAAGRATAGWSCATSPSPSSGAPAPALRDVDLVVRGRARPSRSSARRARASRRWSQLIPRLYDVTRGRGAASTAPTCATSTRRRCAREIAVVTDDPFLFSDTVHENIAYARPDATREEVERAAERAQAAGFIAELPDGYDTRIGERGLTLSGGQRQRIAIARALLADPRILVLDDATSSVDASTEQAIKAALREVMAGRTTFVIAHRLSTIALADEIVVLEDGRVAARGTHDELLEPLAAVRGDRRQGPARPGLPHPQAGRAEGGGPVSPAPPAGRHRPPLARDGRPRAQAARPRRAAAPLPRRASR